MPRTHKLSWTSSNSTLITRKGNTRTTGQRLPVTLPNLSPHLRPLEDTSRQNRHDLKLGLGSLGCEMAAKGVRMLWHPSQGPRSRLPDPALPGRILRLAWGRHLSRLGHRSCLRMWGTPRALCKGEACRVLLSAPLRLIAPLQPDQRSTGEHLPLQRRLSQNMRHLALPRPNGRSGRVLGSEGRTRSKVRNPCSKNIHRSDMLSSSLPRDLRKLWAKPRCEGRSSGR